MSISYGKKVLFSKNRYTLLMPYTHKKSEPPHKKRYKKPISQKRYWEKGEKNDTYSKNTKVGTFEMRKTSWIIKIESWDSVIIPSHMAGAASTGDLVKYSSHMSRFNTLQWRVISIIRRFKDQTYAEVVSKNEKGISVRLIESLYNISVLLHSPPEVRTSLHIGDIILVHTSKDLLPRWVNYISLVSKWDNPLRFVDLLLDQHALSRTFDPLIIESIVLPNIKSERAKREDIRPLSVITIDGLDAKDLDDAISIDYLWFIFIFDITNNKKLRKVNVTAIFYDPTSTNGISSCSESSDSDCFDPKTMAFPMEKDLTSAMFKMVYEEIVGIALRVPQDKENDSQNPA